MVELTDKQCNRRLRLTDLRLNAKLGILEHELIAAQPIRVTACLNLGSQSLLPLDDAIYQVLDYRKVRQTIIDVCTAEHINLLESLTGLVASRLMSLPGVKGVEVQVTKTAIFPDCEVSINVQVGDLGDCSNLHSSD